MPGPGGPGGGGPGGGHGGGPGGGMGGPGMGGRGGMGGPGMRGPGAPPPPRRGWDRGRRGCCSGCLWSVVLVVGAAAGLIAAIATLI